MINKPYISLYIIFLIISFRFCVNINAKTSIFLLSNKESSQSLQRNTFLFKFDAFPISSYSVKFSRQNFFGLF